MARIAQERLVEAVRRAVNDHGTPNTFGLSELEVNYEGPAAGAAGSVVRKWPATGIVVEEIVDGQPTKLRLSWEKDGRSTVVRAQKEAEYHAEQARAHTAMAIRSNHCVAIICVLCSGTGEVYPAKFRCPTCLGRGWFWALSFDSIAKIELEAARRRVIGDFKKYVQEVCPEHRVELLRGEDGANLCTRCQAVDG